MKNQIDNILNECAKQESLFVFNPKKIEQLAEHIKNLASSENRPLQKTFEDLITLQTFQNSEKQPLTVAEYIQKRSQGNLYGYQSYTLDGAKKASALIQASWKTNAQPSNEFYTEHFMTASHSPLWNCDPNEDEWAQVMSLALIHNLGRDQATNHLIDHKFNPVYACQGDRDGCMTYLTCHNNNESAEIPEPFKPNNCIARHSMRRKPADYSRNREQ